MKRGKTPHSPLLSISLLVAMSAVWPHRGGATDILVYNTNNSGAGSLRQAINDNNALGGGSTIIVSNIVTGMIVLSGELVISTNVTILGPAPNALAVSGNNSSRVFRVTNSVASISGLGILNGGGAPGLQGGGVRNSGTLTLSNCMVGNCAAGYGAGIFNEGTLLVVNSVVRNNSAGFNGGGIFNSGALTLLSSSVVSNNSPPGASTAGGIYGGGAITNCTVANNPGGEAAIFGAPTMQSTTVFGNGHFGVNGGGSVGNCIIAGNGAEDVVGAFTSAGYNLIGKVNFLSSGWGAVGDQFGTTASPLNPNLLPLGLYGGTTLTMPPASGSGAIDQGKSFGVLADQRGRPRPFDNLNIPNATLGDGADIGAVELRLPVIYEWTFDHHDLSAALGPGLLTHADAATPGLTSFGTTDGATVPHIGGQPAAYMHVPGFVGLTNGYLVSLTASDPNGGGQFINQYTFIADVLLPGSVNWMPFFNTNPQNQNDADFLCRQTGPWESKPIRLPDWSRANTWYRIAFVADMTLSKLVFFVNGVAVGTNNSAPLDGRWSLLTQDHPVADLLLFNEGDLSGVYTHEVYVAHVAMVARNLSAAEIAILGGPVAEGIFARRLSVSRSGNSVVLSWRGAANVALQKATSLSTPSWQTIGATLGASNYYENGDKRRVLPPQWAVRMRKHRLRQQSHQFRRAGQRFRPRNNCASTRCSPSVREMEAGAVSVRLHHGGPQGAKPKAEVVAEILRAINDRRA